MDATKDTAELMEVLDAVKKVQERRRRIAVATNAARRARESIRKKQQFNIKTKSVTHFLAKAD